MNSVVLLVGLLALWNPGCCVLAADAGLGKLKPVTAALYTKWPQTPLLVEASEFFYDESPGLFWNFLARVQIGVNSRTANHQWTDEEQYNFALETSQSLLSPVKQNFLTLALALRYYSVRIQMYRQIVETENITKACRDVLIDFGAGLHACGLQEVEAALLKMESQNVEHRNAPKLISLDHHYPGSRDAVRTLIVYGNILRTEFWHVHELLLSRKADVRHIFRHYVDARELQNVPKMRIPGYGVEMAIKSTEYKAQDDTKIKEGEGEGQDESQTEELVDDELDTDIEGFDFGKLKSRFPNKKDQLEQLKSFLLQSSGTELQQLKAWQYQDLSLQAAEKSLKVARLHTGSATDALRTLRDISQNFPTQAPTLLKIPVQEEVKSEIERNREFFAHYHNLEAGGAALFINGVQYDTDVMDIFTLFEELREENRLMESLHSLGIRGADLTSILELDLHPAGGAKYGVDIRHPAVNFLNDIEKDKRYAEWPSSVRELIRQSFPPTLLKAIRRNFYNLILVLDPAQVEQSQDILRLSEAFYVHKLPIRIGLVFITTSETEDVSGLVDPSLAMYVAFRFVQERKSPQNALSFLTDVYGKVKAAPLTSDLVIKHFQEKFPLENSESVFGPNSPYLDGRHDGRKFAEKLNVHDTPIVLLNGVPLDSSKLNIDEFENEVLQSLVAVYSVLQRDVMKGELTDHSNVIEYLMDKPHVVPRLNTLILEPSEFRILEFGGKSLDAELYTFDNFEKLKSGDRIVTMASASFYLTKHEEEEAHPVTLWIVADPETSSGRDLLYAAVKHSKTSKNVRVGIVFNPSDTDLENGRNITKAIQVALETQSMNLARNFITKLLKEENQMEISSGDKTWTDFEVNGMDMTAFNAGLKELSADFLKIHSLFATGELSLKPGESAVVANGYLVGPLQKDFGPDDIQLLEKYIESYGALKLSNELFRLHIFPSSNQLSDVVMMTSALLSGLGNTEDAKKRTKVLYSESEKSIINIEARNPTEPAFDVSFIVDPVSKEAQKIIPVLMVLHEALNCRIRVLANCRDKLSELPLKSFYRMVLEPRLTFTENGSISASYAMARFPALPQTALLTMNLLAPDNWLTEATSAVNDLDNVRLEEVDGWGVYAGFELVNLLLEGSAKDQSTDQPPRGTQFILGTSINPCIVDTIVMANLGYFQFKANPGSWTIKLREGRSRDIYAISSSDGAEKDGTDEEQLRVVISSFSTKMMKIYVKKRPDMDKEDVLSDPKAPLDKIAGTGILDSISNYWSPDEKKVVEASDDVINIFSLASGHLYERFLRLMMLSVVKNTKTPVKFWFLKNYLSPQFKEVIPYMAAHYGFQFELVEYKWPRWLHQQSEKQRVIWGYKILFLDVLFPLSVKKIIFVDADQIVRADMKELRDLDLEGAPYGYTPFCESRKEMEGFRFWKNGYWASHLGHRRYHISALYVVDLVKFRKIAAGDRLRAQYQGLSQDPNSLSNLDQDLPNNMIYQVPIKSLPQEWLWCETWCDDASKAKAKTIDLCNNPLTKEPKLTSALRIVAEWKSYDDEIRALLDHFYADKKRLTAEPVPSLEPTIRQIQQNNFDHDEENDVFIHSTSPNHQHQHADEL